MSNQYSLKHIVQMLDKQASLHNNGSLPAATIMLNHFYMIIIVGYLALSSLAYLVPLHGTGVRWRAHCNPKGLQLNTEGDVQPHTGPVITSFFGVLRRVHNIEVGNALS
jgi:hypothetical protein